MKTAIIGMGRMGRRHLEVVLGKQLEVVGICDRSAEAVRVAGEECAIAPDRRFTDVSAMLRAAAPECVVVATHAPSHAEYVCQAAESGARYILCEKPFATSLADCDAILETCRRHNCRLAINHQMRFMQQYLEPKRITDSPAFGGLASINVVTGNFGLAMNGTHYFEMFRFMTGEAPHEVTAWFSDSMLANPRGPEFQDRAGTIRMTTPSGKRLHLESSDDQGHGLQVIYAGRNGIIHVDELAGRMHSAVRRAEHRELPTTRYGMPCDEVASTIQPADSTSPTRAVLDSLLSHGDYPTGEQGRLAVAALVAGYVSHEQGHIAVSVDDAGLPHARRFPWA